MLKRLTSFAVPLLVLGVLVNEILNSPIYTDRELAAFRERDIALAKSGQFEEALRALKALSEIVPKNVLVWGDYLSVMIWAGQDKEAVELAQRPELPPLPDYALAELFEAALRIGDIAAAQRFASLEIAHSDDPEKVAVTRVDRLQGVAGAEPAQTAIIGAGLRRVPQSQPLRWRSEALVAAAAAAATVAPAAEQAAPNTVEPGGAHAAAETPPRSSAARSGAGRTQAGARAPLRPVPLAKRQRPLTRPSAPVATDRISTNAQPSQPVATAADRRWARRDELAGQARQAVQAAEQAPFEQRVQVATQALTALADYEQFLRSQYPNDRKALRNAELDRVRALTLAGRLQEAANLFESLGDPSAFPLYGLLNGADVYARLHRPERAEPLLSEALAQAPDDPSVLSALFYNQLDRERYDLAQQTLQHLQAVVGSEPADGRASWVARMAAMFEAYQNHLGVAQEQLEAQRIHAFNDPDLDLNLAAVYRWRGWAARALREYNKAGADGADNVAVQSGIYHSLMDSKRFHEAREPLAQLTEAAPEHPDTIALRKDWDWFNRPLYSMQAQVGKSSGSPVTGSSDLMIDQWLYSQPLFDQYRVFAHHHYDWADFSEGSGSASRTGFGADYRSQPVDVAVAASVRAPSAKWGVSGDVEWRPDEFWSLFGNVQTDSELVPLRGLRAGIDGHSATVGVGYRWSESRSARVSVSDAEFSSGTYPNGSVFDSNRRQAVAANIKQNLWSDARQRLGISGDLYYSHNSGGDNVPYFNPGSDRSAQIGVDYNAILSRRFERTWSHRATIASGVYQQQSFNATPIWSVEYEQRWDFGPAFSVSYGALYRSRVYDGDREGYGALFGGVSWRF